jgi:transcriptional regulator with XRE-family HTH domain
MSKTALPSFGDLLRGWRRRRGHSQLELSLQAGVSSRHISFVESGRSKPSREMVLHLCRTLQVPLRESNDLLLAAGFAPAYPESKLDGQQLAAANTAIELILRNQEPHPAVVMDRHWNVLRANGAAQRLFARLLGDRTAPGPANVVRLVFAEDGLKPWLLNWSQVALAVLERVRREAVGGVLDAMTTALLEEVAPLAGDLPLRADAPSGGSGSSPCSHFSSSASASGTASGSGGTKPARRRRCRPPPHRPGDPTGASPRRPRRPGAWPACVRSARRRRPPCARTRTGTSPEPGPIALA